MSWTVLRVVDEGVVLRDFHAARFAGESAPVRASFERFAAESVPGIYALEAAGGVLHVHARSASRLVDGMPVRLVVSPLQAHAGPRAKAPPPGPYASVRVDGVCTLLTSPDGTELYESCTASLVAWNGAQLVLVPADRPRVASTSEAALRAFGTCASRPLWCASAEPLAVVNAVKGCCRIDVPGRDGFPQAAVARVDEVLRAATRR